MQSRYFLIAAGVFLIAIVLLASTLLVLAAGLTITFDSPVTEPEITFRTTLNDDLETVTLGTMGSGETGAGVDDVLYQTTSGAWRREIYFDFEPEDCSAVTSFEMDILYDRTNPQYGISATVGILGTPNRQFNRTITGQSTNTWFTYPISSFQSVANPTLISVRLIISTSGTNNNSPTSLLDLRLDNVKYTCSNDPTPTPTETPTASPTPTETPEPLIRPLAESDEDGEWIPVFDFEFVNELDSGYDPLTGARSNPNSVIALSQTANANVYSAASGTVLSVVPLSVQKCAEITANGVTTIYQLLGRCTVNIPYPVQQGGAIDNIYYIDLTNAFVVKVSYESGYLEYLVKSPQVNVGDSINAGCIIGKTLALEIIQIVDLSDVEISLGPITIDLGSETTNKGVAFETYRVGDEIGFASERILPLLYLYPTTEEACNADPAFATCLGDPQFLNPESYWLDAPAGSVQWLRPGAIIPARSRAWMELNLDSETEYSMSVFVRGAGSGAVPRIALQIGQTVESFTLSSGDLTQQFQLLPATHEPDNGFFYSVGVQNTGDVPIEVISLCITEGTPNTAPSSCYFNNPSFDFGTSGWDISSGVGTLGDIGSVTLPDEDSISQDVTLYPNDIGAQMYTMTVLAALNQTPSYTLSDDNFTDYVQIDVEWPESTNAYMTGPSSNDRAYFGEFAAAPDKQIQFQIIFTVSGATTDPMVITALINGGGSGIRGLKILEACIHGPFFDEEGNVIDPGDPPTGECAVISRPTDESLSSWISWLWSKQYRFFKCELMIVLNNIRLNVANTYVTVAWQFRYLMSLLLMGSDWLSTDLFPWLNGHFANIANGRVTVVSGGPNIFDVLLAIINQVVSPIVNLIVSIVGQAATLLLQVITLIIAFLFTVLMQIFVLFDLARMLLLAIIEAWNNATPTPIPGAPDCIDPQSSAICMGIWVLDNTIFSGTGAAIIPIMIAIGSIHLLIWVVYELKKTIVEVGASS